MSTTFTNGRISITKDLIFGISVLVQYDDTLTAWIPITDLEIEDLDSVLEAIDNNPTCPYTQDIRDLRNKKLEEKTTA